MPKRRGIELKPEHISHITFGWQIHITRRASSNMGKLHFKKGAFPPGKGKAQRVFIKSRVPEPLRKMMGTISEEVELRNLNKIRELGLPVPRAHIVEHNGHNYLVLDAFFEGKKSRLTPVNSLGNADPVHLRTLKVSKDRQLIQDLASDLCTLYNNGFHTKILDFWGFYKGKGGRTDRIIMDAEFLEYDSANRERWRDLAANLRNIKHFLGEKEWPVFIRQVEKVSDPDFLANIKSTSRPGDLFAE